MEVSEVMMDVINPDNLISPINEKVQSEEKDSEDNEDLVEKLNSVRERKKKDQSPEVCKGDKKEEEELGNRRSQDFFFKHKKWALGEGNWKHQFGVFRELGSGTRESVDAQLGQFELLRDDGGGHGEPQVGEGRQRDAFSGDQSETAQHSRAGEAFSVQTWQCRRGGPLQFEQESVQQFQVVSSHRKGF